MTVMTDGRAAHESNMKAKVKESEVVSRVRLFGTPWTVAYQAPPSMGFSRQGYWSGSPFQFTMT